MPALRFLSLLFVCTAALSISACNGGGSAYNPPGGHSGGGGGGGTQFKHMYVAGSTCAGSGSSSIYVFNLPVTSSSTPAQTDAAPAGDEVEEIYADSKGRLFVPIYKCNGSAYTSVAVFDSPVTSSSQPAFALTASASWPENVAEDKSGNVYVSIEGPTDCCIDVFDGPVSGNMTDSLSVGANGGGANPLNSPYGMAFDGNGNLYVSSGSSILEYATPLTASSAPTASVTPNDDEYGIAVDSSNRIFVSNATGKGMISVFTQPFTSSSSPAFNITLTSGTPVYGLAFDGSGNLWATDNNNQVWEIAAPISASSTPSKILTVPDAYGITFGP